MTIAKTDVAAIVKRNLCEILPELSPEKIDLHDSMRDLGANSVDRADVVLQSMEELQVRFPLGEAAGLKNLQELVDFLYAKLTA